MSVSGLVITFNEEKNIRACILSLKRVCDEIIVVDSNSSDKTVEIANSLRVKVISQDFLGDGPQRIFGIKHCKHDWILNLDADERLDEDSYEFIKNKEYLNYPYDAYNFRFRHFLGKQEIDHSGWYPSYTCRFFYKKTAKPSSTKVHQSIQSENLINTKLHIIHYGWKDFHQIIGKYNLYTTWQSEEMLEENKNITIFTPLVHGFWSFLRCYFLKKGVLNGLDGLTFSMLQSFFSYMKYEKYRKLKKSKKNK